MIFKSEKQLKSYLLKKSRLALIKTQEEVYAIIKRFLYKYYGEYHPVEYDRTFQLLQSLVQTRVVSTGSGYEAEVYFDFNSLNYLTGSRPSGKEVMDAAAEGLHGVEVVAYVGTGIWNEPKQILDTKAIDILKDMLISEGIPIK